MPLRPPAGDPVTWTRATAIVVVAVALSAVLIYAVTGFPAGLTVHALRLTF